MKPDPDSKLIQRCQSSPSDGLEGSFRELYELYKDRVYNVCYRITGNSADALDAAQETFGILFRKLGGFRFESKFSSWVYRIAVNASIDLKRRSSSRQPTSLDGLEREPERAHLELAEEDLDGPVRQAGKRELELEVQHAILRLSPKMRAITVLRYIEDLTYDQIAETLQISIGTVKSRLARAHQALDRELTPVLDRHYLA
ncbi:MAG: RNA polymerase sigma-70 factor (ECF subfamily) [Candidatus Paceibacteria bacterium]|jgi:RNA polymerase sigma-70 factor (ECF subfamily)